MCVIVYVCANTCVGGFMVDSGRGGRREEGGREEDKEILLEKGP